MKPTRIVEEPRKTGITVLIKCDNGKIYDQIDLAKEIGISSGALFLRLKKWGWKSEKVLAPVSNCYQARISKSKETMSKKKKEKTHDVKCDLEGKYTGTEARPENLLKIPGPTKYERRLYGL